MSTATIEMARNKTDKPLVFSDQTKGVFIEFGKAGAEDGSDVQAVPEEALKLPQFVRLLQRDLIEMLDAEDEYTQKAGERAVASAEERDQRYRSMISDARQADPQQRDLVFKVEDSERQGKVPTYTRVEDGEDTGQDAEQAGQAEQATARPSTAADLGSVVGAGEHDEDGKPVTTEVRVTMGEPLPSES